MGKEELTGKNVLVSEDSVELSAILVQLLSSCGCTVTVRADEMRKRLLLKGSVRDALEDLIREFQSISCHRPGDSALGCCFY